jgi:hypothetical protein
MELGRTILMKLWQPLVLAALTLAGPLRPGLLHAGPLHAEPLRAAVFPFELDDTSLQGAMQGKQAEETARLQRLGEELSALLAQSGRYAPVDIAPVRDAAREADFRTCDGCEVPLARKLGAAVSVIGWVQKVSNLILNINVVIRDDATGGVLRAGSVDIRGNTDEAWLRGLSWLVKHRLLDGSGTTSAR